MGEKAELTNKMKELKIELAEITRQMTEKGFHVETKENISYSTWKNSKAPKFKTGESFNIFCERFTDYVKMTKETENLDTLLMQCVDDATYLTLKAVVSSLSEEEKIKVETLCEILKEEYLGHTQAAIKQELMNLKQNNTETITQFCNNIQAKARQAYGSLEGAGDIAQLVLLRGLKDESIRRKLNEASLTSFEDTMKLAKHLDSVNQVLQLDTTSILRTEEETHVVEITDNKASRNQNYGGERSYDRSNSRGQSYDRNNSRGRNYDRNNSRGRTYDRNNSRGRSYNRSNSRGRSYNRGDSRGRHFDRSNSRGRENNGYRNNFRNRSHDRSKSPYPYTNNNSRGKCYNCGIRGHYAANCYKKRDLN